MDALPQQFLDWLTKNHPESQEEWNLEWWNDLYWLVDECDDGDADPSVEEVVAEARRRGLVDILEQIRAQ